ACIATLLGCVLAQAPAQAAEPPCYNCEQTAPMLSKVPYLGRLFKNVGIAAPTNNDNIQVVWEWEAAAACPNGVCEVSVCPSECCQEKACNASACGTCEMKVCDAKACAAAGCQAKCGDTTKLRAPHCVVFSNQPGAERLGVD